MIEKIIVASLNTAHIYHTVYCWGEKQTDKKNNVRSFYIYEQINIFSALCLSPAYKLKLINHNFFFSYMRRWFQLCLFYSSIELCSNTSTVKKMKRNRKVRRNIFSYFTYPIINTKDFVFFLRKNISPILLNFKILQVWK